MMKYISILAILVLFLVFFEMPTIKANVNEACLREYNPTEFEMPDIALCMIPSMPSMCVKKCRETREGAKGGKCEFGEFPDDVKCKTRLKYGMRLYQEVRELSQITEDNRQLYWFKNKQTKQNKHAKELEESLGILRHSMKMQHAQNREEEFSSFLKFQEKEMKTFMEEREKKMAEMNKRYFEEMLDLEREFDVFGAVHDQERLNDADDVDY
ncbi:hypothetical protein HID58_060652 [Brassica napus]|uniref:Uncharacterized protein n=2 Tax=Brassica TaxID=3705 RepID=A0A3P6CFV9_BRAOL|nr:hypothetical protein HID58_060652 [Brassica napus]CAF1846757.1 unnamed protein product [Brassica napus]VDD09425.1 unnamed protein product [Brassica oleracea]